MYVLKHEKWFLKRVKDYSSIRGYLDKRHPTITHEYTPYLNEAMAFKSIFDAIALQEKYRCKGEIIKAEIDSKTSVKKRLKQEKDELQQAIEYLKSIIKYSDDLNIEIKIAKLLDIRPNSLDKFLQDPLNLTIQTREKIISNIPKITKENKNGNL